MNPARILLLLLLLLACLGGLYLVYAEDPHQSVWFPPCPFNALTGLYCPGCGSTRALHLLLHGQVVDALGRNLLMVVSLPILGLMLARPSVPRKQWVCWTALVVLISYGILRNIPMHPFGMLAP